MSSSVTNIRIEPVDVYWQGEEQWNVECLADVSSSLQNKYIKLYDETGAKFHAWFNVGGAGVDPAPSGSTDIEVSIAADASAATVAAALQAAVDAEAKFQATVVDDVVTITVVAPGEVIDFADQNTGFTLTQCADGLDLYLGLLDGDVEATFEEQALDVTAHQTGTTVLAALRQGVSCELGLTLKESDFDKFKAIFAKGAGGTHTPGGGTEVFGWGTEKQGTNTFIQSKRLILHPVNKQLADKSRDLCFWKAYPMPDTMTFSGENPQTLAVSFKAYRDESKPEAVNVFVFGDWSQYLPA